MEIEILAHADSWRFHKRGTIGFIIPRFLSKLKKWLYFLFPAFTLLVPLHAIFKSAAYFGVCFSWAQNGILILRRMHLSLTFLLRNFHCYKFMCPDAKLA